MRWSDVSFEDHIEDEKDIPPIIRKYVLERDGYRCRSCGAEDQLGLHHVIFRSRGGKHNPENLVCVCNNKCHIEIHLFKLFPKLINGVWYFKRVYGRQ